MLRILTLRLIVLSLILTLVFIALIFSIMITQWRDLPAGGGSIIFEMAADDIHTPLTVDLLKPSNFWIGEQFDTLIDPSAKFDTPDVAAFSCSPNGQLLLIVSRNLYPPISYLLNMKDKVLNTLTNFPSEIRALAWSPNQNQVAYIEVIPEQVAIFTANSAMSHPKQIIGYEQNLSALAWSPDSREIAFTWYDNSDGSRIENIEVMTGTVREVYHTFAQITGISWSPDGSRIVFGLDYYPGIDIYTIQPDGSNLTRLTDNGQENIDPRWSPDGSLISYSSLDASGHYQLYVMNADGSDQHLIFAAPHQQDALNLCWLPTQKENS